MSDGAIGQSQPPEHPLVPVQVGDKGSDTLRLGFLDGLPGYHYCRLLAIYEYMIVLKMKEIRRGKC